MLSIAGYIKHMPPDKSYIRTDG